MSTRKLTVALPDGLLARIRDRARRANRTVEAEVLDLLSAALPADPTPSTNGAGAARAAKKKPFRTSLADWAEENAEHWGDELRSDDVEGFTGRRF